MHIRKVEMSSFDIWGVRNFYLEIEEINRTGFGMGAENKCDQLMTCMTNDVHAFCDATPKSILL